jgi:integrase/recombinase XerD
MGMPIHDYETRLHSVEERIREASIPEESKTALFRFRDDMISESYSVSRVLKLLNTIFVVSKELGKPLEQATEEDIRKIISSIERSPRAEWTKLDYRIIVRKFYTWLRKTKDYPPEVAWISVRFKKNSKRLPEDLLNEEEVKRLILNANNPMYEALIAVLYETGCRIGELLPLDIKQISQDKYGFILTVHGKTGGRRVRIVYSVPYLSAWLNKHPLRDDPNSPVWMSKRTKQQIGYKNVIKLIREIAKKAEITKRVNPHSFRHARATAMANHLTEAQMKEYFGWVQESKMAAVYVHLSGRDVDTAILKANGIVIDDEKNTSKLISTTCFRCKESNEPTNKFCKKCGIALDENLAVQLAKEDLKMKRANALLDRMLEDKTFEELFRTKAGEVAGLLGKQIP